MQTPKLFDKADVTPIVRAHLQTMHSFRTGRVSPWDIAFFFGFPLIFGTSLCALRFGFRIDAVNGFLNTFAILTGLMLNLLVLVFSLSATASDRNELAVRRRILKEVFTNVCYCIVVAILVTITALVALSYMRSISGVTTGPVATFFLSSLTANFVATLLMIMNRMYRLINSEFKIENASQRRDAA